jgi:hypothetical protein
MANTIDIPKDADLGYVCEVALQAAITKNYNLAPTRIRTNQDKIQAIRFFDHDIRRKTQIISKLESESNVYIEHVCNFYNEALRITIDSINNGSVNVCQNGKYVATKLINIIGDQVISTTGGGTAVYDVETKTANLHVKLNQSKPGQRLVGFQISGKKEILDLANTTVDNLRQLKGSKFGISFIQNMQTSFAGLKSKGQLEMMEDIKSQLAVPESEKNAIGAFMLSKCVASSGKISKPAGFSSKKKNYVVYEDAIQVKNKLYNFEIDWDQWWPEIKNSYKRSVKKQFLQIMPKDTSWHYLLQDIKAKVVGEGTVIQGKTIGKTVLFFNYVGGLNSLNLEINKYQIENCGVGAAPELTLEWLGLNPEDSKQPYGIIYIKDSGTNTNRNNPLFYIEIRTDGEGHPPQLKIGPGLKDPKFVASYIYKQTLKNKD